MLKMLKNIQFETIDQKAGTIIVDTCRQRRQCTKYRLNFHVTRDFDKACQTMLDMLLYHGLLHGVHVTLTSVEMTISHDICLTFRTPFEPPDSDKTDFKYKLRTFIKSHCR